jgi:hypothetical protein
MPGKADKAYGVQRVAAIETGFGAPRRIPQAMSMGLGRSFGEGPSSLDQPPLPWGFGGAGMNLGS